MSLQSELYYWVTCDGCEASAQEGGEFAAWQQADVAVEEATEQGWLTVDGKDLCNRCLEKLPDCAVCGDTATEHDLESDQEDGGDGCQECDDFEKAAHRYTSGTREAGDPR